MEEQENITCVLIKKKKKRAVFKKSRIWILKIHPLLHLSPIALNFPNHQNLLRWVGSSHQVAKVWSFNISPSSEYSGLVFFRIDWFDLAVQGTLKSLLQHRKVYVYQK